jgi:hypothetical protein
MQNRRFYILENLIIDLPVVVEFRVYDRPPGVVATNTLVLWQQTI